MMMMMMITASAAWTITPKRTEHNLIVCTGKSEAKVTNNRRLCSMYCTVEANYWMTDTKHRAASLRQQNFLLVIRSDESGCRLFEHLRKELTIDKVRFGTEA